MNRPEGGAPRRGKRSLKELPPLVRGAFLLVWQSGRREFLVLAGLQVFAGIAVTAQLLAGRSALAAILVADGAETGFSTVVPKLLVLFVITAALSLVGLVVMEHERLIAELVARRSTDEILRVSTSVSLEAFETPDFYDRLQRARQNAASRPVTLARGLLSMLTATFGIIGIGAAMVTIQPLIVPMAVLAFVPVALVASHNSRAFYAFSYLQTPTDRTRSYLFSALTGHYHAKEVRAFDLGDHLRERHDRLYGVRIARLRELLRGRLRRLLIAGTASALLSTAGVLSVVWLLVDGRITVAEAGTAFWGLMALGGRLRGVNAGAGSLYESALFLEDFTTFLKLAPPASCPDRPVPQAFERLVVDSVGFTYPGATRPALDAVSMEIGQAEVVALVGENGSGKTTLAKLLAHLHEPESGRILWDGVDTAAFDQRALRRAVAVLFQDFVRWSLSAGENVGLGRHERIDDRDGIVAAARRAEADAFLSELPEGYDTLLSRMFAGGSDLSTGQWQLVSLARSFFRDARFLIMDEPTASLDARAEAAVFERARALAEGRPLLLISHRFSNVRLADRIYFLDKGRIVEHGTHAQLMAQGGYYARLFNIQAAAYRAPAEPAPVSRTNGASPTRNRAERPPVSVIVPAYNESRYIGTCIEALLHQTYEPLELIVVDDGSRDATARIAESFEGVRLLRQDHRGPAAARNLGASSARGEIVVIVDADMVCPPPFVERLVAPMLDHRAPGTFTKEIMVANGDRRWARAHMLGRSLPPDCHFRPGFPDRWEIFRAFWRDDHRRVGGFDEVGHGHDATFGRKLGVDAEMAPGATCYHFEPDTLREIFWSARWMGRGERIRENPGWHRAYLPRRSLQRALRLAGRHRSPSLFVYRMVWDAGIITGAVARRLGNHR